MAFRETLVFVGFVTGSCLSHFVVSLSDDEQHWFSSFHTLGPRASCHCWLGVLGGRVCALSIGLAQRAEGGTHGTLSSVRDFILCGVVQALKV